jgi:hypothetical protein
MKAVLVALVLVLGLVALAGCGGDTESQAEGVPSGADCAENIAYLQAGVDAYRETVGSYPVEVEQLLETAGGQGPFVQVVPACPGGNDYVIENGRVREVPAR